MITLTIDYGTVASILIPTLIIALVILFFYSMDARDEIGWHKMENDMCLTNLRDCRRKGMKLRYEYDELMKNYKDLENKHQALKKEHEQTINPLVRTARLNLYNAVESIIIEVWDYNVEARSKDYDPLPRIKECIEMYLEEKEGNGKMKWRR